MIIHTVSFLLKHPKGSTEEKAFLAATLMLKDIPGVQRFEQLRQVSKKNKFSFGLSMEFADQKDYEAYNNHPIHTRFIQQYWIPDVEEFLEADYQKLL
ncbi:MAG TPA: Dabb family protein [Agriterribacter sp.]|nr:Dabb family protein [Chitinophagaceae bacterium]HRP31867.1 Dabb family protein [Agriterribacter sp.]